MTSDLDRFVAAQDPVLPQVRRELAAGRKASHWMWFVFPQIEGLGTSPMAQRYAIRDLDEAKAYLAHPVLGPRLRELAALAAEVPGRTANQVFGSPDDLKFRACLTLFLAAGHDEPELKAALDRYYDGVPDPLTLARLG